MSRVWNTSDSARKIYTTADNYIGFVDAVKKGTSIYTVVILNEGQDYKVSNLDSKQCSNNNANKWHCYKG